MAANGNRKERLSDSELDEVLDALERAGGNGSAAARLLDMPITTFKHRLWKAQAAKENKPFDKGHPKPPQKPFTIAAVPDDDLSADELIEHMKRRFERKRASEKAKKLLPVKINIDGPVGITHFGDPHVDDDGTDIGLLERHLQIVKKTDGMFGANLGDLHNNWVGRLARLYAEQGTSAKQAWKLVEWMLTYVDWLYLVGGNHDAWSGPGDPLQWIMRSTNTAFEYHGVRLDLQFPTGKHVRVNARHDFAGHSMWNANHGPMKAIQGGWRDHIATCGHKHVSFTSGPLKDPATGLLSWAIRCAGYKTFDGYANEKGLPDQNAFPACVTIIDPRYADDDTRLITVIPDVETGADFLKFLRRRAA